MRVNIFTPNDWNIKEFISVITILQIIFISFFIFEYVFFPIPILKNVIILMYLLIPGYSILRIFKIHNISTVDSILYAIGLSIASIMFLGLFINSLYPILGINNPFSLIFLVITLTIFMTVLSCLAYYSDKKFENINYKLYNFHISPFLLFLSIIPFIAVIGAYLFNLNLFSQNIPKLILILIICAVFLISIFKKNIKEETYPYILFICSISLLLSASLFTNYLWGWDIQIESYLSNLVITNSFWDFSIAHDYNAMISVTTLAPILSILNGIGIIWIFKIVYPLIFAFVPVALYQMLKKQTESKIALLASFFFITSNVFFLEILQIARQQIAELFLILILLSLLDNKLKGRNKTILVIVFSLSLVVSHYALSYLYMLLLTIIILLSFTSTFIQFKFNLKNRFKSSDINIINYSLLVIVFALSWYIFVSSSSIFENIVNIVNQISGSIFSDFLDPSSVQGLGMITQQTVTPLRTIFKIMNYGNIAFTILGALLILKYNKFSKIYNGFIVGSLALLIFSVTIPNFSSSLNTQRVYQLTLIFLAPCFVIGGIYFISYLKKFKINITKESTYKLVVCYITLFFLLSSGFIYEVSNDQPSLLTLNKKIDGPYFNSEEISAATWLTKYKNNRSAYADLFRYNLLSSMNLIGRQRPINQTFNDSLTDYFYLGTLNINERNLVERETLKNQNYYQMIIENKNEIYDNQKSRIFYS
ncbi:MAG: DUF2206 domain-containing protein [Methanobacteriaceae archaeon]|nr:DUF2206 domain-containing protein [Methanobacteriaceae archaeon]